MVSDLNENNLRAQQRLRNSNLIDISASDFHAWFHFLIRKHFEEHFTFILSSLRLSEGIYLVNYKMDFGARPGVARL